MARAEMVVTLRIKRLGQFAIWLSEKLPKCLLGKWVGMMYLRGCEIQSGNKRHNMWSILNG